LLQEPENNDEVKSVEDTDSEAETAELTIDVPDSKLIQANLVVSEAKTFSELGLSRWVCEQLRQLSVKLPTPVQLVIRIELMSTELTKDGNNGGYCFGEIEFNLGFRYMPESLQSTSFAEQ
uniref:DEAD-box RNA helicase Q domain-containing protein n=1 Tax=Parascaris equorum TaxID=6256 RepID=A0A914RIQ4_PAREQ